MRKPSVVAEERLWTDSTGQYAVEELGAVVVEAVDWPRKRDGDDLAPVVASA